MGSRHRYAAVLRKPSRRLLPFARMGRIPDSRSHAAAGLRLAKNLWASKLRSTNSSPSTAKTTAASSTNSSPRTAVTTPALRTSPPASTATKPTERAHCAEAEEQGWAFEEVAGRSLSSSGSSTAPGTPPIFCRSFVPPGAANPRHARRRHCGSRMTFDPSSSALPSPERVRIRLEPLAVELELLARRFARCRPRRPRLRIPLRRHGRV